MLAKEIGKIPEIYDGISETEAKALKQMIQIYEENKEAFDMTFKEMYEVGLPEIRKYCTPLQALFWLSQDGKLQSDIVDEYSLDRLLDKAWTLEKDWKTLFNDDDKQEIIQGLKSETQRKMYSVYFSNYDEATVRKILYDAENHPSMFTRSAKRTIKNAKKRANKGRWKDFDVVTSIIILSIDWEIFLGHS